MFNEWLRDLLAVAGVFVSATGLAYAIWQLRKTKSAAEAAREAARHTMRDNRLRFHRHIAAAAQRFLHEAKIHIDQGFWERADIRLTDLADYIVQLDDKLDWQTEISRLREFAAKCGQMARNERRRFTVKQWAEFVTEFQSKLDRFLILFKSSENDTL